MDDKQSTLFGGFKAPQKPLPTHEDAIIGPNLPNMDIGPIIIKQGVIFKVFRPEIYTKFGPISRIFHALGKECVITSANDSIHKEGSRHYQDKAIDLRSHHLADAFQKHVVLAELKAVLGSSYVVLFENEGTDNEHLHIQWQG